MKVLVLTRYSALAASSRYRFHQYFPYLTQHGIEVTVAPLLGDGYINKIYNRPGATGHFDTVRAYARRVAALVSARRKYDLLWVQMEAFPWLPGPLESALLKLAPRYVVDYDDAWFHRYELHPSGTVRTALGGKIERVMRDAALVVAGNDYIAARARQAGARRIEQLPTVIDLEKYPLTPQPHNAPFTVGWIGSPRSDQGLRTIQPALAQFCREADARLVTVGSGQLDLPDVPIELRPWTEATEVAEMLRFDVGIMPLQDSPWERGKCGFKLIQNMATARPVIASPVGVNDQIVSPHLNGFLAETQDEWLNALRLLHADANGLRQKLGAAGRRRVEQQYCLQVTAPLLTRWLREAAA